MMKTLHNLLTPGRRLWLATLLIPLSLDPSWVTAQEVTNIQERDTIVGRVVRVGTESLTIEESKTDKKISFTLSETATVQLDNQASTLTQLKIGDVARITQSRLNPDVAMKVEVIRTVTTPKVEVEAVEPKTPRPMPLQKGVSGGLGITVTSTPNGGVLVLDVQKDSPADKLNMVVGDYIRSLDAKPVRNPEEFFNRLHRHPHGETVKMVVWRNGNHYDVYPELDRAFANYDQVRQDSKLDLMTAEVPTTTPWLGLDVVTVGGTVVVKTIDSDSPVTALGVTADDVIVSVAGETVASAEAYYQVLKKQTPGETVSFIVRRNGKLTTHTVQIGQPRKVTDSVAVSTQPVVPVFKSEGDLSDRQIAEELARQRALLEELLKETRLLREAIQRTP